MIAVGNYNSLRKACLGNCLKMGVHISDKKANIIFAFKTFKVVNQAAFKTVGQYIQNFSPFWIGNDALVFLSSGISFELVYGHYCRQFVASVAYMIEISNCSAG